MTRRGALARATSGIELLYDPFEASGAREDDRPPRTLWAFFKWSYRGLGLVLIGLLAASLSVGLLEVSALVMIGWLVDIASATPPEALFAENQTFFLLLAFVILLGRPLALMAQAGLTTLAVTPGLAPRVLWGLHRHSLGQSLRFFEDDFAGRLAQKQMQTSNAVQSVTVDVANAFGLLTAYFIGMTVALGAADWRLAGLTLLWAGGFMGVLAWSLPSIRAASRERAERRSIVSGQLVDSFSNIKTVKLFAHAGREEAAAQDALQRYRDASLRFGRRVFAMRVALAVLNAALMGALVFTAIALWRSDAATLGLLSAAGALAFRLTGMSSWIAATALGVFTEIGVTEDGIDSLAGAHEVVDPPAAPPAAEAGGAAHQAAVQFDGVRFRYGAARGPGLSGLAAPAGVEEIELTVAPGEKVGLVGPSGAGKSTLVSLLLRLYDLDEGRILVDGVDVSTLSQDALRAQIGVITQESAMFNRSALANIRYGRPDATEAEAMEAARRAQADAFIRALEDRAGRRGYRAHLGERGVKLSGGQRQRIALARVLLKDAPILILDEATSALDSEVESVILDAVDRAAEAKTVIAIAHRLSTIARMDRIVVMAGGRIVECGPHADLLRQNGLYARLWARQADGFIGGAPVVSAAAE